MIYINLNSVYNLYNLYNFNNNYMKMWNHKNSNII